MVSTSNVEYFLRRLNNLIYYRLKYGFKRYNNKILLTAIILNKGDLSPEKTLSYISVIGKTIKNDTGNKKTAPKIQRICRKKTCVKKKTTSRIIPEIILSISLSMCPPHTFDHKSNNKKQN